MSRRTLFRVSERIKNRSLRAHEPAMSLSQFFPGHVGARAAYVRRDTSFDTPRHERKHQSIICDNYLLDIPIHTISHFSPVTLGHVRHGRNETRLLTPPGTIASLLSIIEDSYLLDIPIHATRLIHQQINER
mmetsp:Transcript_44960/g.54473  ORF Transcript_44960/g.54473 Transcript_44960/m.54473 type:complete len:132 (-) Transcript_44960:431-826(-)